MLLDTWSTCVAIIDISFKSLSTISKLGECRRLYFWAKPVISFDVTCQWGVSRFVSVCTTGKMAAPENSSGYSKKIKDNFISILTLLQTAHLFLNALLFHFFILVVVLKTFRQLYSSATTMCYTQLSSLPKPLFGFLPRVQLGWQVLKPKTAQTSRMRVTLPWLHCHYHLTFPLVTSMVIEWVTRCECYVASSYATICFLCCNWISDRLVGNIFFY